MDILTSLSFIRIPLQVGNLSQWQLNRKTWKLEKSYVLEIYTITVIMGSIALLVYGIFSDDDYNKTTDNEIGQTVDFIQLVGIRVAHIVSITEAIIRRNEQQQFYEKVREIDRIFECSLNVNVDNKHFRQKTIRRGLMIFFIYLSSELFILGVKVIATDQYFSLFWIFYLMPFFICGLRYFHMFITIMIIRVRFDKLIEILGEIDLKQNKLENNTTPDSIKLIASSTPIFETFEYMKHRFDMEENPELKRLLIIRDLYNRLWELTSIVNHCFGISMLINIGNDFISITSNCYWIFLNFKEYSSTITDFLVIASSAVWSIPHLLNVLTLALTCDRTVQRATGIALGLHRIKFNIWNDNHNTVIEQFSLQLLHQKMAFTAAGFFNINCTLLYTIAGATTTYLIILIQFHMNEQKVITKV